MLELFNQNIIIFLEIVIFVYLFLKQRLDLGIYFVIFFLPAYLVRFNIFGIPSTALEIGIYILFIIWLVKNYHSEQIKETMRVFLSDQLFVLGVFLLMASATISTTLSSDLKTSAGILKGWFFDPLLFFIVLVSAVKTYEQRIKILTCFFASGAAVGVASLVYWFFSFLGGVSYDGRLHAFYASPNYLAMYLAPAFLVGVWGYISSRRASAGAKIFSLSKYLWLAASLIIALAIYLTFSYAAWISLAISLFLLYFLSTIGSGSKNYFRKKIIPGIFILFVLAVLIFSQSGSSKLENLKSMSYRSSFNSRLMIWRAAWEIGKGNPLIGIGPGNFQKYYLDYQSRVLGTEPYLEWAVPEPHNIFLAFWLQTGVLGLVGFVTLILWFFKKTFGLLKKTRDAGSQELAIILCSVMVYILLHGLVDTTYWKNDLAIIFWMVLGLVAAAKSDIGKIF